MTLSGPLRGTGQMLYSAAVASLIRPDFTRRDLVMPARDVLAQLEAMGTEQNRKIYTRHGVAGPMFGVSYANLGALKKKIKVDQGLAEELWDSGNHDARVLAAMVADPRSIAEPTLDAWVA